ncbi:MAG: hypothetical protein IT457_11410 [Planctomycetes bacterium]|nr:hypothetical protein [Planctomycetota bacterium]
MATHLHRCSLIGALLLVSSPFAEARAQGVPSLVLDIENTPLPGRGGNTGIAARGFHLNGYLYLSLHQPSLGWELWRTDGTPAGTTLVKDILPGPGSGLAGESMIARNGIL